VPTAHSPARRRIPGEISNHRTSAQVTAVLEMPVKPSAQPTLVRTQHLPPGKTAGQTLLLRCSFPRYRERCVTRSAGRQETRFAWSALWTRCPFAGAPALRGEYAEKFPGCNLTTSRSAGLAGKVALVRPGAAAGCGGDLGAVCGTAVGLKRRAVDSDAGRRAGPARRVRTRAPGRSRQDQERQ